MDDPHDEWDAQAFLLSRIPNIQVFSGAQVYISDDTGSWVLLALPNEAGVHRIEMTADWPWPAFGGFEILDMGNGRPGLVDHFFGIDPPMIKAFPPEARKPWEQGKDWQRGRYRRNGRKRR